MTPKILNIGATAAEKSGNPIAAGQMRAAAKQIDNLQRTLDRRHFFWMRAARSALEGDMAELRNRVEMAEAEPLEIVLSTNHTKGAKE